MISGASDPADRRKISIPLVGLWRLNVHRRQSQPIPIPKEHNPLPLSLNTLIWLDPLTPPGGTPHGLQETQRTPLNIRSIVTAHNRLDGLGGLVRVVEGDGGDVVVQHVRLDDAVEDVAPDEAEFAVDGCGCAADVGPGFAGVVWEGGVGVLEVGDGDCFEGLV